MASETDDWDDALTMLFRPRLLLQGTVEYFMAWIFTRGWGKLILVYSPILLLLIATGSLVGYGMSLGQRGLVERYARWAGEEVPETLNESDGAGASTVDAAAPEPDGTEEPENSDAKSSDANGSAGDDEQAKVTAFGDLLLRRLLKLQNSNSRITFYVALELIRNGRLGQGRQMMRRIAPEGGGGFPMAHAWLATDQLANLQRTGKPFDSQEDRQRLLDDLSVAVRSTSTNPALLSIYADFLASQGSVNQAVSVLENSIRQTSSMPAQLKLATMFAKDGQTDRFNRLLEDMKVQLRVKLEKGEDTPEDYAYLANVFLLERNPQQARKVAQEGLRKDTQNQMLLRLASESFRIEYLLTATVAGGKSSVNLALLDAALKTDPTNPAVGTEIARLLALGQDAPRELQLALEQQLAGGNATALTHILLANRSLAAGKLNEAIPHLELALRQAPNSPVIMNNLAIALSRTDPESSKRALELASSAVRADPINAEFLDSLGEVRARAGDNFGAIQAYEAAIGNVPDRRKTRQKLADLYRELGMEDSASAQESAIKALEEKSSRPDPEDLSADPALPPK